MVRGREQVLRLQPLLSSLAARCGQLGAVDYLEYFLTGPYVGTKTPCLFLVQQGTQSRDADNLQAGDLLGAVLMYEYRVRGIDTHIYVTDDDGGERTVLASPEARLLVASEVARALIDEGARGVLMSLRSDDPPVLLRRQAAKDGGRKRLLWTSRERTLRRTLPLETTFDQTLAPMGKHTRRNLRASRRRTETELQARFVPAVEISLDDFVALNRLCSYPVPDNVSVWRYETAAKISGGFMVGVISGNGEWLSLLGGRRHHGVTEIGWQMNRESLEEYSLSNVMRSYLIEHEISLGARKIYFEGGTTQSIQSAFTSDKVMDLLVIRTSVSGALLRRFAPRLLPTKNLLAEMLQDCRIDWKSEEQGQSRGRYASWLPGIARQRKRIWRGGEGSFAINAMVPRPPSL